MLTGKMVRVRYARENIVPHYLDVKDENWLDVADQMIRLFRNADKRSRGELDEELREMFGNDPSQLVHQGLGKLLEDRCEFEVVSGQPPDEVRACVFRLSAEQRAKPTDEVLTFDRQSVLDQAVEELGLTIEQIEQSLFADLRSEQRLSEFKDITAERLLHRYNVALAQAVLLRSRQVTVIVRNEPPQRYRQLLRRIKFHRLMCEYKSLGEQSIQLRLDGPLSLFSSTQKYGLQLAMFLPAVLLCKDFELKAELLWGAQRKLKHFTLTHKQGLVSHYADSGMYVPDELTMFVELFRKRIDDWELREESEIFPLGRSFWVPDFRLVHRTSGETVLLEVLGFWRRSSAEQHLSLLRKHVKERFLLAVSDQLHIDEAELEALPAEIHRFRQMPLPDEVAKHANALIGTATKRKKRKPRE